MSTLQAQTRDPKGLKPNQLRKQGVLPMALVRRNHTTELLQAPASDIRHAMMGLDGLGRIEIDLGGGQQFHAIVKQVDRNPLKNEIIHVTLQEVSEEDRVKMDVPVVPIGTPEPVELGQGILVHPTDHIKLRGRMDAMPDHVEVDVSALTMTGHIGAGDVELPEGIELMSSPDAVLFSITAATQVEVEVPTEEGETEEGVPQEEGGGADAD